MSDLSEREQVVLGVLMQSQFGDLSQVARDVITALHLAGFFGERIDAARRWADVEPLLAELRAAIKDEGPFPQHHQQVMIRHRREWPTLWNVLGRLVPVSDGERLER